MFYSVQSVAQSCPTPCNPMDCSMPGFPVHHQLPELAQTHVHWIGDAIQPSHLLSSHHLIFCHPLFSCLQSFPESRSFPTNQFFTSGGQSIGVSASTSVLPMNKHSGLISFRMDWLDLLAVQGTLKSLFQHHNSKASILWCSAFFIVQLSHSYMTTEKSQLWLEGPLSVKLCLCFLICCPDLS